MEDFVSHQCISKLKLVNRAKNHNRSILQWCIQTVYRLRFFKFYLFENCSLSICILGNFYFKPLNKCYNHSGVESQHHNYTHSKYIFFWTWNFKVFVTLNYFFKTSIINTHLRHYLFLNVFSDVYVGVFSMIHWTTLFIYIH